MKYYVIIYLFLASIIMTDFGCTSKVNQADTDEKALKGELRLVTNGICQEI